MPSTACCMRCRGWPLRWYTPTRRPRRALIITRRWLRIAEQGRRCGRGATAAAAGAIAGAVTVLARQAIPDWKTGLIAAAALAVSLKWKAKEPYLVAFGAAAGIILH